MFRCFDPITGGRVSEIVSQESGNKASLPLSKYDDKFERFCENYESFIDVADAHERFSGNWERENDSAGEASKEKRVLLRALLKSFYGDLLKAFFSKLVWSILVIFSIWYFVFDILDFIKLRAKKKPTPGGEYYEYYLCAGFFGSMFVLSVGIQQMGIYSSILGGKVKAALTTAIFKKMIVREAFGSEADVVSLVAKDVEKLAEACLSLQYLWSGIVETIAVFVVVVFLMGSAVLPGLGLMCVFLPLQYWMGLKVAYQKKYLAKVSKRRISLMEEILRGIKLVKIYGWEASFFKNLNDIRTEEGNLLSRINTIKATIVGLIFCLPPLMCMVIFGTQEATGKIEPVLVFTVLSFFNTLRVPFSKLPKSLRDVLDASSCLERIQDYLAEPDLVEDGNEPDDDADAMEKVNPSSHEAIFFHNVSVSYGHGAKIVLSNVNLNIPQGSLMMVAGPVASGKSNLLKSILCDLTIREGTCHVSHSKAYVPQIPWTALGSVRENILFGKPFDEAFYRQVLHACALEPDLKLMADSDETWIGERGGNLSGGQKQRIALARAAYSRADLYVLDSPLSAVDMYTCQHIFKFCIQELMIGGGGTVVLATHQTELFSMSDHLVVMEGGRIAYNDRYTFNGIKHLFPNFEGDEESSDAVQSVTKTPKQSLPKPSQAVVLGKRSTESTRPEVKPKSRMTKAEKQGVYGWYINKLGVVAFTAATLFFCSAQIIRVYSDFWVSVWTKRRYTNAGYTKDVFYAGLYVTLVSVFLTCSFLRAYIWFFVGKVGANKIHDLSFGTVLKAPMHFFHVTPIGKLLSFFSHDVDTIDDVLVDNTLMLQIFAWILIIALGLVAYNLPLFLAIVAGLGVAYVYIVCVFIRSSVPLKKAAGQSLSNVIAHTSETQSGLAIVRAFRMQDRFIAQNLEFQARSTVVTFSIANLSLWLAFRVDLIGSLLVLACCLLAILNTSIDASDAGLIVSNSFQILLFFSIMSRTMGEVHDNMNSIEQARVFSNLEVEHEPAVEIVNMPGKWPSKGEIQFEGVVMPYLPNTPPVLKGITFSIREGEKIGVVGRTGAGKSSLIVALYRMAEISEGKILVDSIDCSCVNLNKLRTSMAIIPQEPVMFGGTLRTNLDPFNKHKDEEILDVLHKCLLGPMVDASEDGLEAKVDTLGSNFSLGTQQLICLARAMLNPSRVLLLDEATAALDSDTNVAVQHVLKAHFSDRTIFTIAHRLDTIIDYDRILVMSAGVVAEFDRPEVLLENPTSIFYELCMNTGKAQFAVLAAKARARKGYGGTMRG
jgi:ATP-binding cassette, subfamily C (CFTR/MRP), member 1